MDRIYKSGIEHEVLSLLMPHKRFERNLGVVAQPSAFKRNVIY
jgi:hypothetical protein